MALSKPPLQQGFLSGALISREWATWLTMLWQLVGRTGMHGTTAQRPTTGLYIGLQYFDETIGKPIWLQQVNPTLWRLADGTVV